MNVRVGLTSASLPQEIIRSLLFEQDLMTLLQEPETDTNNTEAETIDLEPVAAEMNKDEQEHEPVYLHQPDFDQL